MLDVNPKRALSLILFLSFLGVFISTYQTFSYVQIVAGLGSTHSFCDFGKMFDCTTIEMSKYAEFLPGFPLAGVAIAGYFFIFVLAFWQWRRKGGVNLRPYFVVLGGISVLFSFTYFMLMLKVGKLCLLCLTIDFINVVFFIAALSLPKKTKNAQKLPVIPFLGFGMLSLFVSFVMVHGLTPAQSASAEEIDLLVDQVLSEPVQNIEIPEDAERLGAKNAKVTIIEFGDFQCPPCRSAAAALAPLFKRYGEKVQFVFLNFPWAAECNPFPKQTGHPFACEAAEAAYCANEQGLFLDAYETLFENQESFETGKIASLLMSKVSSLDVTQLNACLKTGAIGKIKRDAEIGIHHQVNATPTFFVNGHKAGGLPTKAWMKLIDKLITS